MDLVDVYVGPGGVLIGSARLSQETREKMEESVHRQATELRQLNLERKRKVMQAQISAIQAQFEAEEAEVNKISEQENLRQQKVVKDR